MTEMVRTVQFDRLGGSDVLNIVQRPLPRPGPREVLIRARAIGLNRAENLYRAGRYMYQPDRFPSLIGYEAAGTVEAVGDQVHELAIGDKVATVPAFKMSAYGVYAEAALVPVHAVVKMPTDMAPEIAASVWMQYVTAYGALVHYGNLRSGQTALFTAATGGLGVAAIQIARMLGVISIATTRRPERRALLESLAPDHVIVTDEEDVAERTLALTGGRGPDFIWDAVGGPSFRAIGRALAKRGEINIYGGLNPEARDNTPVPWLDLIRKGGRLRGYTLFELTDDPERFGEERPYHPTAYPAALHFVLEGLTSGNLKPVIAKLFPFAQIRQARDFVENNTEVGKTVVLIS
jgi:NADPH:quinone reductase